MEENLKRNEPIAGLLNASLKLGNLLDAQLLQVGRDYFGLVFEKLAESALVRLHLAYVDHLWLGQLLFGAQLNARVLRMLSQIVRRSVSTSHALDPTLT